MRDTVSILLVEDDPDDCYLLKDALNRNGVKYNITEIGGGDKVLPYLKQCKELPHVIVLDLNLPRMHGRDVLSLIKSELSLQNIPLMVLTTSNVPEDKVFCLALGANSFITKPTTSEQFDTIIKNLVALAKEQTT